jgi:hypothetical protein
VCSLQIKVDGSHLNLIRAHDGHPHRDGRRHAASRFGLRPTRLAATKDLHHFLGHQLADSKWEDSMPLVLPASRVTVPIEPYEAWCSSSRVRTLMAHAQPTLARKLAAFLAEEACEVRGLNPKIWSTRGPTESASECTFCIGSRRLESHTLGTSLGIEPPPMGCSSFRQDEHLQEKRMAESNPLSLVVRKPAPSHGFRQKHVSQGGRRLRHLMSSLRPAHAIRSSPASRGDPWTPIARSIPIADPPQLGTLKVALHLVA